jgi:dihydrodipicolinate synthase/N-acetylneuraminate lyase
MLCKDSAGNPECTKVILKVQSERKGFYALNGDEFAIDKAIAAGYTGMVLGGGCFNGAMACEIYNLVKEGKTTQAAERQQYLNNMMYEIFGGKSISTWMAGQKTLMVRLGIFNTAAHFLSYRLTEACSDAIDAVIAANREYLLPRT